jgi:hypothetical protein
MKHVWKPKPGSGVNPTPEQFADSAERIRLWQEHGVLWTKVALWYCPVCGLGDKIWHYPDGSNWCSACAADDAVWRKVLDYRDRHPEACSCELRPGMNWDDLVALGAGCRDRWICPVLDFYRRCRRRRNYWEQAA